MKKDISFLLFILIAFNSCSITHSLHKNASRELINQPGLQHAYVGICIYDPAKKKILYKHDANKYFTPASNTKLYTFFTGLSILGDSTTGIQYQIQNDTLYIRGTGDPSLLHPDFSKQPAFDFLKNTNLPIVFTNPVYENNVFGPGWAWDDYSEDYQPERSAMPLYGNVAWFTIKNSSIKVMPKWFSKNRKLQLDTGLYLPRPGFNVHREQGRNIFHYNLNVKNSSYIQQVPFIIKKGKITAALLQDTLHKRVDYRPNIVLNETDWRTVHNVALDSLFKHTMYRSDNFYAEQIMQMSAMKLFDTINTYKMIHYMLQHQLKDLPDAPRWVDGSGLSRFNLFSPEDMVTVLRKIYTQFPPARIDSLLPTGGKGTLSSLYHDMTSSIFAKTGSLSNNVTLSGYLITQKKRLLIFSIMINHCRIPLQQARIAMESFLREIWEKY